MRRRTRSILLTMRASSRLGRAFRLRDAGETVEALNTAREALAILAHPDVVRRNGPECSVLAGATVLVEELASQLEELGAGHSDILDALHFLQLSGPQSELAHWIPYLEHKANGAA
jgi:hypothetical protein